MNVVAVSHFVDDAIAIGVVPVMPPMVCSWITAPSAATILIMPRESPADRTRSSSNASVASNASGAKSLRTVAVVGVAGGVVLPAVVEVAVATDDGDGTRGAVVSLVVSVADDPQPTSSSPAT